MARDTFRFPDDLKEEAVLYAKGLGISLNALVNVSLREYLDSRGRRFKSRSDSASKAPQNVQEKKSAPEVSRNEGKADSVHPAAPTAVSRNAPCPCGSGKKYKKCCGSDL